MNLFVYSSCLDIEYSVLHTIFLDMPKLTIWHFFPFVYNVLFFKHFLVSVDFQVRVLIWPKCFDTTQASLQYGVQIIIGYKLYITSVFDYLNGSPHY